MSLLNIFCRSQEFKQRLEASRTRLYRLAYSWCHDTALADDLAQETLEKALKKSSQLRDPAALETWLFSILTNCWRDHFRRSRDMLDIDDLPLVINYELPHVPEDYIHRIGRTGRAGASGEAISFVAPDEERYLADIERLLKKPVRIVEAEGFDPTAAVRREHSPRERPPRERPPRERAPRERSARRAAPEASQPKATPERTVAPDRAEAHDERPAAPSYGDQRREERERAYAMNPDQPRTAAAETSAAAGALTQARGAQSPTSFGKGRPVPALLMKRPRKEPEQV